MTYMVLPSSLNVMLGEAGDGEPGLHDRNQAKQGGTGIGATVGPVGF
eukprot:gene49171-66765_t